MKYNSVSSAFPAVLPAAEHREAERSEDDRSGAAGKTVAPMPPASLQLGPKVFAKGKHRTFTADYKLRALAEADAPTTPPGAIGALLRRQCLCSSLLVTWHREWQTGILMGLTPPMAHCWLTRAALRGPQQRVGVPHGPSSSKALCGSGWPSAEYIDQETKLGRLSDRTTQQFGFCGAEWKQ